MILIDILLNIVSLIFLGLVCYTLQKVIKIYTELLRQRAGESEQLPANPVTIKDKSTP